MNSATKRDELCFCLLTPQSNGIRCDEAVQELRNKSFHSSNINPVSIIKTKTRFHNTKAKSLLKAKKQYSEIKDVISSSKKPEVKRKWLVNNVKGMSMKESSHFLRNIGHRNLAILDRHILKNLEEFGVIKEIPSCLTEKRYLEIEKLMKEFAMKVDISLYELDLLLWSKETGKIFK